MAKKLGEFATPNEDFVLAPTTLTDVAAEQFEIKAHLVTMVQHNNFGGSASKDASMHLHTFTELCAMTHIKDSNLTL